MGLLDRIGNLFRIKPAEDASKPIRLHIDAVGTSGTEIYSGYYYEEYLQTLRGTQAADEYDKMRRGDAKIKMVLSAVKNPIKAAHWTIQPASQDDDHQRHAELIEQILFKDISFNQFLSEMLTVLDFGFSMFEVTNKVVMNHKKWGNYNSIAKVGWRSPRTIERWNLDPSGALLSVSQYAYGDLGRLVDIPAEFLLIFTNEKEGDNYEGISALRSCYGAWRRKNTYLKLMAIGIEKFAIPTPFMEVPAGQEETIQFTNAQKILQKYVSHQQQYITYPAGWKLGFAQSNFDASKIREAVDKENNEIATSFLENFLELGQSGSGSYALSNDLSDFFLTGIEHIAFNLAETINKDLIPHLVKLNFGPQDEYPELTVSGIKDKPGKELAEIMTLLTQAKIITPDADLEKNFREKYDLPKQMELTETSTDVASPGNIIPSPSAQAKLPQLAEVLQFAEKPKTPRTLIAARTDELKMLMKEMLGDIGKQVVSDLMAKKKRANPSQYLDLTSKVKPVGSRDYKAQLKDLLANISSQAIDMARKEIPGGSKIKLSDSGTLKLQELQFSQLPQSTQKMIESQIGLLTTFQIQDLLKAVYFQFNSSVTSTDSDDQIEADLNESIDKYLDGSSLAAGAGNTVAKAVNESRTTFFFEEDALNEIESFTFVNGDPVSPICQDLAGTVFSKTDPNFERYSPPLHHNCKSYLVPNLKGTTKELDANGLQPSKTSLEKFITLSDIGAGKFAIQSIEISKKIAMSQTDAKRLALEITVIEDLVLPEESDHSYKYQLIRPEMLQEGSLKSFEPIQGVHVFFGRLKGID